MSARDTILQRLFDGRTEALGETQAQVPASQFHVLAQVKMSLPARLQAFQQAMAKVEGEVIVLTRAQWPQKMAAWLADHTQAQRILVPPAHHVLGQALAPLWQGQWGHTWQVRTYDAPIETWQAELFNEVDLAITSTRAGIAQTGSLVLWPTPEEPRLMSLVPPIHVAILDSQRLYNTFYEVLQVEAWAQQGMPTNALLISGPSKTADIEQTLAYGVHGPKRLIVFVLVDEEMAEVCDAP
ncbi:L-lactate dehydrogenase complex protein LldG [Allopseudospirillum japonicum]|uniref:L-lactate dehydrogenase complex protein LldG n=1 Tax=Allopseudospirillum japonicum TaxID=64971 RepID=A0A1H6RSN3_9GAMM|nr:lactate utilization protein [Allopseudospirillum japonicum]SEI55557.1 L-lactate dehydrogenase complex protein LldG [Allopseudospirillum japonicum]